MGIPSIVRPVLSAAMVLACAAGANAELAYGVTEEHRLITFNTATPDNVDSGLAITGLVSNEIILGIDIRPSDNLLYALGSQNNLYRLNPATGAASLVGALSMPLNGTAFGFDFNPTGPVALRIVSNTDFNYRLPTPGTNGDVLMDATLAYVAGDVNFGAAPNITHVAYTNSVPGATSTVLYAIDAGTSSLVRFGNANEVTLNTVAIASGGNQFTELGGFDISGATGIAYAAIRNSDLSRTTILRIDLTTGITTSFGEVGGGSVLNSFTIVPAPGALAFLATGGLFAIRRRR
jgi:hypothetical protein